MTQETDAKRENIERYFGAIDEGGILTETHKFRHFPWYLVSWYGDGQGAWDKFTGDVETIGFHASYKVEEADRQEYGIPEMVFGYIVREDNDGFCSFEEYETEQAYVEAWSGIEKEYDEFFRCDTCEHVNFQNGDGCQVGDEEEQCICQECQDNLTEAELQEAKHESALAVLQEAVMQYVRAKVSSEPITLEKAKEYLEGILTAFQAYEKEAF